MGVLTGVFTEHLWTGCFKWCQCSGPPSARIQTGIWEIHGANYTILLAFRGFVVVVVWFGGGGAFSN